MLMRKECVNNRCSCLCWHELGVAWAESKCVLAQDGKQSCWSYWVGDRDVCGPPVVCQYPVEVRGLICPVVVLCRGLMCVGGVGSTQGRWWRSLATPGSLLPVWCVKGWIKVSANSRMSSFPLVLK